MYKGIVQLNRFNDDCNTPCWVSANTGVSGRTHLYIQYARRSTFDDRRNLKYMREKEFIFQFVSGSLRVHFNRIYNMSWKPDRILSF